MNIIDFLKNKAGSRLTYYKRWLIWDTINNCWIVYKPGTKGIGKIIIETEKEEIAIKNLIY